MPIRRMSLVEILKLFIVDSLLISMLSFALTKGRRYTLRGIGDDCAFAEIFGDLMRIKDQMNKKATLQ